MTQVQIGVKIWVKIKCSPIWHTKKPTLIWDREHFARFAKCRREHKLVYSTLFINKSCKTERNIYVYKIKTYSFVQEWYLAFSLTSGSFNISKTNAYFVLHEFPRFNTYETVPPGSLSIFFLSDGELKTFR